MKLRNPNPLLSWLLGALCALALAGPASANQQLAGCTFDAQCDDGLFCNGREVCDAGSCRASDEPVCNPGHVCDEKSDTCRGRMDREQLWQTLWGPPLGERTVIEVVGFDPRDPSGGLLELRGLDDEVEVGTSTLAPLHQTPTPFGHRVIDDGTLVHGEVFVHYVAGQVLMPGRHAIAVDGLLITAELADPGGATPSSGTVFMVQSWGDSSAQIHERANAFHRADAITDGSIEPSFENGVPQAYLEDACFDGYPDYPGFTNCGRGYCGCFIDEVSSLLLGRLECLTSVLGLNCLRFATNPVRFLACIIAGLGSGGACSQVVQDFVEHSDALTACRATSDACFCASGEFPQYCDNVEVPIDIHVSGLRPGEHVDIETRCWDPATGTETNETTRFQDDGFQIVRCVPDFLGRIRVSGDGVRNPSLPNQPGRSCTPASFFDPVDVLQYSQIEFDCGCNSFQDCPSFFTHASVEGLAQGEELVVSFAAQSPAGTQFFSASTITDLEQMVFESTTSEESWLWSGARIAYFSEISDTDCEIRPVYGPNTPITPPPGTHSVRVADILCGECSSQNAAGAEGAAACNIIDFKGRVFGSAAVPVTVAIEIDGVQYDPLVTPSGNSIAQVAPGAEFKNVRVIDPEIPGTLCRLVSETSGTVPLRSPFTGVVIGCYRSGAPEIDEPFHDDTADDGGLLGDLRGPNGWGGEYYCPEDQNVTTREVPCPPEVCPSSEDGCLCEETTVEAETCYWRNISSGTVLDLDRPWLDGRVGAGPIVNGRLEVDERLVVNVNAGDPDGMQAVIVQIGNEIHAVHHAGGHSLTHTGRLEIDTSGLAEGVHEVMLYALDNHSVAPLPGIVQFEIAVSHAPGPCELDEEGPSFTFATPAPGTTPQPGQLWISVAPDDPADISNVHFFVDGQMRHNDTTPPFGYTWWAAAGPHTLKARAFDHCGNETILEMPVTIADPCGNLEPADITITNFTDGEWLNPALYHVEAAVNDPDGVGVAHVEFQVGGFSPRTVTAPPWRSNGHYLLSQGDVEIQARVYDQCGRERTDSVTVTISESASVCSIDLGPPSVAITSPVHGELLTPGAVTVETATTDDTVLFAGALWVDGQAEQTILSGFPDYAFQWQAGLGQHALQARATDVCWNVGFSPVIDVDVPSNGLQGYQGTPLAPYVHVLEGTAYPAGRPIEDDRLLDFGTLPLGGSPPARPISFVNDGNTELVVTGISLVGDGFELVPATLPITVPPFREMTLEVQPKTDAAGLFEATVEIASNAPQPISIRIASRVRSKVPGFSDSFESGDFSLWDAIQGAPMSVVPGAATHGQQGARAHLDGVTYNFARLLKNLGKQADFLRARIFFDPRQVTLGSGEYLHPISSHGLGATVAYVRVRRDNGIWQARLRAHQDDGSHHDSSWLPLGDGPVGLELAWQAAIEGQDDGYARLSIATDSGVLLPAIGPSVEIEGLDNDQSRAMMVLVGSVWGLHDGTSGSLDFDAVTLWY